MIMFLPQSCIKSTWHPRIEAGTKYIVMMFLVCASALEDDQPYCSARYRQLCQGKGPHVACEHPNPGPGPSCRNYTQVYFDHELRHFVTHYINRRRQHIAAGFERVRGGARLPRPRIMMFVEWDRELATLAQRLADQCRFMHDECRATVRYPYAGQTVGEVRLRRGRDELVAQRAVRRVLDAWWGERRRAEPKHLVEPFHLSAKGSVWGHFSQFAIWSLRAVGCGAARHGVAWSRLLLVCDFSHTNMLGQRTIEPGLLAPCPGHMRRRVHSAYPLLCTAIHHDKNTEDSSEAEDQYEDEDEVLTETTLETTTRPRTHSRTRPRTSTQAVTDVAIRKTSRVTSTMSSFYKKLEENMRTGQKEKEKGDEKSVLVLDIKGNKNRNNARTFKWKTDSGLKEDGDQPRQTWYKQDKRVSAKEKSNRVPTTTQSLATIRQRGNWKQTRHRPRRPGEVALLQHSSTAESPTGSSFLMDKEDAEQVFRDTGFHPAWKAS